MEVAGEFTVEAADPSGSEGDEGGEDDGDGPGADNGNDGEDGGGDGPGADSDDTGDENGTESGDANGDDTGRDDGTDGGKDAGLPDTGGSGIPFFFAVGVALLLGGATVAATARRRVT